ncbi:A-kinase anchor protein 10, mitochondrial isoform X1 [Microplitis demolitor]|uniref:A-kinase anchor protein 10, mitochondrial isoform X1 n=1 Tax=Microplitis demolitor TaxID=69319 RepID=UPI0006D4F74C|nr:A-kinase anchor protein 10, mitochondrial isoform X1 [Microplitis demolitor]
MLQFFKKTGRDRLKSQSSPAKSTSSDKSFTDGLINLTTTSTSSTSTSLVSTSILSRPLASRSLEEEEVDDDEEIRDSLITEISSARSRLSKTLIEILDDKDGLGYFIQFMESRGKLALIKYWMEVEFVRETSHKYIIANNINLNGKSPADNNDDCLEDKWNGDSNIKDDHKDNDNVIANNGYKNNYQRPKTRLLEKSMVHCKSTGNDGDNGSGEMSSVFQDALKIYKKYILKDHLRLGELTIEFKAEMEEAAGNLNVVMLIKGLLLAQKIVYKVLEDEYINDFLRSKFHCKHQIDVLTSGDVKLADILFNETAFFYFMEFMELENKRELLDFWMSAINYKQNLLSKTSTDPKEAQADALIIYEKYFSLQATMPLGFTDKIRFLIEQNICCEGDDGPQPDCFDKPSIIVYNFLSKHYLPAFLSSQLYYKYLSELISTIQSGACASHSHQRLKRAESDCSSEVSIFSLGTHDTTQMSNNDDDNRSSRDNKMNCSLNIDTRQLYDPDSLWKRHKYSLSVGYVDSMGRFVTEIERDPHRKYESRLSRAVKRLIHMEEDKAKEELAWKIAEMIVREITSLTLGVSELPS